MRREWVEEGESALKYCVLGDTAGEGDKATRDPAYLSIQLPTIGAGQSDLRVSCELDWEGVHCPPLQGYLPNSSAVYFPGPFLTVATESLTKPPKREGCVPAVCRESLPVGKLWLQASEAVAHIVPTVKEQSD